MKKILILILFCPLFSCNDWLNVESEVSVTYRNYFQSEQDIEDIYFTMLGYERDIFSPMTLNALEWTSLYCDEVSSNVVGFRTLEPTQYEKLNDRNWNRFYNIIYLANMLEDNRHRFENVSKERADYWIAQANFHKALMYFEIARRWGDAPIAPRTEDASAQAKSPADSVLAEAIRAAEAALILPTHDKLTDANGNKVNSRQYASIGSVHTLLANIYAWLGGLHRDQKYWEKAEQEASLVIDSKAGFYDLVSIEDLVEKTFGDARDVIEVIYAIEISSQDKDDYWQGWFDCDYPGKALINYPYTTTNPTYIDNDRIEKIRVETVEALYSDPKDLRRKEFWLNLGEEIDMEEYNEETGEVETVPYQPVYAYINKWREPVRSINPEMGSRFVLYMKGNRVYWRLADLILLRAECRTHLGMPEAVEDLDRIRNRAGMDKYRGSREKKALLREIFNERNRELFGETCRYYDVVRNGYFRELFEGNFKTLTDEEVKEGALYLPVSDKAFNKNTLMKQNTYWSWHLKY